MDKMVSPRPAMAICGMVSWPLAITLALGACFWVQHKNTRCGNCCRNH